MAALHERSSLPRPSPSFVESDGARQILEAAIWGDAGYGAVRALDGVSMRVCSGETVALLDATGNGKSTLMRCGLGLVRPWEGAVRANIGGKTVDLDRLEPEEIVALGIVLVPEGRRLFKDLSVREIFPRLRERRRQRVGSMSGGEQQMAALGRAVMAAPEILLVDEPSVGLAPILVRQTIAAMADLKRRLGPTVLMAEQNLTQAIPRGRSGIRAGP